jgi:hypothetical protein
MGRAAFRVISSGIASSPMMAYHCVVAEPFLSPTQPAGGDGDQGTVLLQPGSAGPGRHVGSGSSRQTGRRSAQCHRRSVAQTFLAVCTIGQGLAAARSLKLKHAVKQVDRLLRHTLTIFWFTGCPTSSAHESSIVVALDWTDFDAGNQATITGALINDHGRSTPLVRLTVDKRTLKDHRSLYEYRVPVRLAELLPAGIKVRVGASHQLGVTSKGEG